MADRQDKKVEPGTIDVEYVTRGGMRLVKGVSLTEDKVAINEKTYTVPADRTFPGRKGRLACRIAEGNPVALPVWTDNPGKITARQLDSTAHDNSLEQLYNISRGGRAGQATNMVLIIGLCVLGLVMVSVAVVQHNELSKVKTQLDEVHAKLYPQAQTGPVDGTTGRTNSAPPGGLAGRCEPSQGTTCPQG